MALRFNQLPQGIKVQPQPFHVATPEDSIDEFKTLLKISKLAAPTYENSLKDGRLGLSREWLIKAKDKWVNDFNWRTCEQRINSFPNFKIAIQDKDNSTYDIHFIALFSKKADAIPVILLHGWPGSFLEFLDILSLFAAQYTPEDLPYHLIVPSIPGYAYSSSPPLDADFGTEDVARLMNQLMLELGFGGGYVVQGGDLGSRVARIMAVEHEACKAVHLNYVNIPEPDGIDPISVNELEKKGLERAAWFKKLGSAYAIEHGTKPSTIGLVLATNPLALLAWIGEKFLEWTDEDPELDTILEAVTLYWFTETFPRAIYPYRQNYTPGNIGTHENPLWHIKKPLGFSWFPKELTPTPKSWVATTGNLVFYKQHKSGGHFAALERPDILKDDLVAFIEQVWAKK